MNTDFGTFGLTITQAAYWLEIDAGQLATDIAKPERPTYLEYCFAAMAEEFDEDPEPFQFFQLGAQLKEDTWSARTARAAIPILIEQAKKGEVITYGDLDAEMRRRNPSRGNAGTLQKYGMPLGIVGDIIEEIRQEAKDPTSIVPEENEKMPPIEALVVRNAGLQPGKGINGFLTSYLSIVGVRAPEDLMLRDVDRKKAVDRIHADIFAWKDWSLLEKLVEKL